MRTYKIFEGGSRRVVCLGGKKYTKRFNRRHTINLHPGASASHNNQLTDWLLAQQAQCITRRLGNGVESKSKLP